MRGLTLLGRLVRDEAEAARFTVLVTHNTGTGMPVSGCAYDTRDAYTHLTICPNCGIKSQINQAIGTPKQLT